MKPGDIFTLRVPYMAHRRIEAGEKLVCVKAIQTGEVWASVHLDTLNNGAAEFLVPASYAEEVKQ